MTVIINEWLDMIMRMGLSRKIKNLVEKDLFGTTNTIRRKSRHTNLRVQENLWKIFGMM